MLEQARDPHFGTAWMRDSNGARALRVRDWSSEPSPRGLSFFAPDFGLGQARPWLTGEALEWAPVEAALPRLVEYVEPSSASFARLHEEILTRIARGEFSKVVPVVSEKLEFAEALHVEMFARLWREDFPNQFAYGFEFQNEGLCGVTPELLFSVRGGELTTMALAGTGPAGGPSLLEDSKERLEHQLVIDHIVSELRPLGAAETGATIERSFGLLKHLYTPIHLRLKHPVPFMELVVKLHPTAALGGWPRLAAVEWLEKQEFHVARQRFGAPFGFNSDEEMRCVVAIRGLQWQGTRAILAAGCGVVQESQALREWNELALKRRAVRGFLGIEI